VLGVRTGRLGRRRRRRLSGRWAGEVEAEAGGPCGAAARCGPGRAACAPIRVRSAAPDHVDAAGVR